MSYELGSQVIRFPVYKPLSARAPLSVTDTMWHEEVHMVMTPYKIIGNVHGTLYKTVDVTVKGGFSTAVCVAAGYRCEKCNKIFFAADADGLKHECMEWSEPK